ncbi:MaoC like domain-containing protein [Chytriomyces sp. MP71]|nr:MaoC like domain-containing protein [Chytriomyces sp. MP71]
MDLSKAVGFRSPDQKVAYNRRDLILYALSIGATDAPFSCELDTRFGAFPTYALVLPLKGVHHDVNSYAEQMKDAFDIPGLPKIDFNRLVHGDQSIELFAPLPKDGGTFTLKNTLIGVYDAGKGMVTEKEALLVDARGTPLVRMGPKRPKPARDVAIPERVANFVESVVLSKEQALLYRLSGDYNPLHADPSIGKKIGMKGAILHGLCTFGHAAAAILRHVAQNDASRFKSIRGQFAAPVYPGDTLSTHIWVVETGGEETVVAYVSKVGEKVVIAKGVCVLKGAGVSAAKL